MPIILPHGLPARWTLKAEGLKALSPQEDAGWTVGAGRPLRVLLINLMPDKPTTERQIARMLADTPHRVELSLAIPDGYRPKTTDPAHMAAFYRPWSRLRHEAFDGLIVTGAPVETLPFEEVTYWPALGEIFDWARSSVPRSFYICWAAQAALQQAHGVPKRRLETKLSGVYRHRVHQPEHPLLRGFGQAFVTPVSRHTEVRPLDLPAAAGLQVLASSTAAGLCALAERDGRALYMFNHLEYEADTLGREYVRDLEAGQAAAAPRHYFPCDDPTRRPVNAWGGYGRLLFGNWLKEIHREVAAPAAPTENLWSRFASRWQSAPLGACC